MERGQVRHSARGVYNTSAITHAKLSCPRTNGGAGSARSGKPWAGVSTSEPDDVGRIANPSHAKTDGLPIRARARRTDCQSVPVQDGRIANPSYKNANHRTALHDHRPTQIPRRQTLGRILDRRHLEPADGH